jgi:hypothetical protein
MISRSLEVPGALVSPLGPCSPFGPGGPCGQGSPLSPLGPFRNQVLHFR